MRHALIGLCVTLALAVLSGPWLVYQGALLLVDGRPLPPPPPYLNHQRAEQVWRCLRQALPVKVVPASPHAIAYGFMFAGEIVKTPGTFAVWQIAREHNRKHLWPSKFGIWHTSGAALTVWLTRNWTSDQIVTAAYQIIKEYPDQRNCGIGRVVRR